MEQERDRQKEADFYLALKSNQLKTPNDFTIGMGQLIKAAREERGLSQVELAKGINRRPATISDIENGKSEIGVLSLTLFAIVLQKPITYFFPDSLVKELVSEIKSPFQYKMLELAHNIEFFGDPYMVLDVLNAMLERYSSDYDAQEKGYPQHEEEI